MRSFTATSPRLACAALIVLLGACASSAPSGGPGTERGNMQDLSGYATHPDASMPDDMATSFDLAQPPDFSHPEDLAQGPPDMSLSCEAVGGSDGNGVCIGDVNWYCIDGMVESESCTVCAVVFGVAGCLF